MSMRLIALAALSLIVGVGLPDAGAQSSLGNLSLDPLRSRTPNYRPLVAPDALSRDPAARHAGKPAAAPAPVPREYSRVLRRATPGPDVAIALDRVARRYAGRAEVSAAGLSPARFRVLFRALIQHESGFDPRAVSPKGAMGLGQIMPQTARSLGLTDPFAIEANLDAAARYLVKQLGTFRDARLALAAYNAGPGAVQRYNGVPPFRETQAYVAAIGGASLP